MTWLAIDIGGANLKLADGHGFSAAEYFAMWKQPEKLAAALCRMLTSAPGSRKLAVTMTGELADCFESKTAGVRFILDHVLQAASGWHIRVYLTDGRFVPVDVALTDPLVAAASNWHALATFAGRYVPAGPALLIDVGSTTCDLIPLLDGCPAAVGANDTQRLLAGELLYTGVQRSPLCAVVDCVPYRGGSCPLAHELFATMLDAYLILGEMPEDANGCETADGRPATRSAARSRLARMICADQAQFDDADASAMAAAAAAAQTARLARAFRIVAASMPDAPRTIVASGHGDFLLRRLLVNVGFDGEVVSLSDRLGPALSRVAASHALAVLARETMAT